MCSLTERLRCIKFYPAMDNARYDASKACLKKFLLSMKNACDDLKKGTQSLQSFETALECLRTLQRIVLSCKAAEAE